MDVTIRGAGVFGLAIAYACARRGARVQVVDPFGVAAGASGGVVGALAPHVPEAWNDKKAFQLDSLLMSQAFWAGVSAASGLPTGYGRTGRLQPVPAGGLDLARARGASAAALWQGRAAWRVVPAAGWLAATPGGWMIEDTLTARINPRAACAALAGAVRALGGVVLPDAATSGAAIQGAEVWATGAAGLADLSAQLGQAVGGAEKGQALLLAHAAPDAPQLLADGIHIVPQADGTTAVGSTSERVFASLAVDEGLERLLDRARALVPDLAGAAVLDRWAGLRPRTTTRAPVMGQWPGRPGVFVANGGFKIGFGIAPKVAEVMADLILEGRDTIPEGFRIEDCLGAQGRAGVK